jgi:hypothetical protein
MKTNNHEAIINSQQSTISSQQSTINNLKQNPVPIGFIYVQLSGQPEPEILWSMVEWADVSSDYAGLFFRTVGGGSAVFGQTQNENSPRVVEVLNQRNGTIPQSPYSVGLTSDSWSNAIYTGDFSRTRIDLFSLKFRVSGGEVRPRNKAIRIWKRTK